jgi:hypothetical protein
MLYELRQYTVKKGKMKQWLALMEKEIMPFQVSQGMTVPACFTAVKNQSSFIWMRRFKNEADRKRLYKKVYESDQWKSVISPKIDVVLERKSIVVTDLTPTGFSVLQ